MGIRLRYVGIVGPDGVDLVSTLLHMLMERVIVLARAAFGRRPMASLEDASFSAAIDELRKAMNAVTKEDLGLHRSVELTYA
jgi:hypothetical protein